MKARLFLILLLAALAGRPAAQQQDAFVVHSQYSMFIQSSIYQMDNRGTILKTLATLPSGYAPIDIVMGDDNRTLRVLAHGLSGTQIAVMDIPPNGGVKTIAMWTGSIPSVLLRTDDGDWAIWVR